MKKTRDPRHKTVHPVRNAVKMHRKLSIQLGHQRGEQHDEYNGACFTPTAPVSGQFNSMNFSNRNSGKINMQFLMNRGRQKSQLQCYTGEIRKELVKLSFREKLVQIQSLFKNARNLCKKYGYFYVTFAMLHFTMHDDIKINLWIHPDLRCTKPLHPIKKDTNFECELECVHQIKNLIRTILPTIDLGDSKTFSNIIAHLESLKTDLDNKMRKTHGNVLIRKDIIKSLNVKESGKKCIKTEPHVEHKEVEQFSAEDENNRKMFKVDQKNKQTKSTLMESFRSVNSIKERLKFQISNSPKPKENASAQYDSRKRRKISWMSQLRKQEPKANSVVALPPPRAQTLTQIAKAIPEEKDKKSHSEASIVRQSNIQYLKTSIAGKKLMSMSIEMQSQINNLFNSEDSVINNYYFHNPQKKVTKHSMLSKVAEEFEDLF